MANAGGGFIILGCVTEIDSDIAEEKITEIEPFDRNLFEPHQYEDILKTWIYPALDQVEVLWWPCATDHTKGLGVVRIHPQPTDKQPFLVTRTVSDSGKKVSEIIFGHFERRRTSVDATSVARIHSLIQIGLRSHRDGPQLESIQQMLEQILARMETVSQLSNPISPKDIVERTREALIVAELDDLPAFTLSARPVEAKKIPTLLRSRQEAVVKLLEDPPTFRQGGFHLKSSSEQAPIAGNRRRTIDPKSHVLELWRDGTLLVGKRGDETFLCWSSKTKYLTVNPVVLIEAVFEFVELSRLVYKHAEPEPEEVEFRIGLLRMNRPDEPARMGARQMIHFLSPIDKPAPDSDMLNTLPANLNEERAGAIVFKIVASVYEWFGIEHDRIPFRESIPETRQFTDVVDLNLLKSVR